MDEKSTPISSLNNQDDSQVVNQLLDKYNDLQGGNNNQNMEQQFEDRNINQEIYKLKSDNSEYQEHYQKELKRTTPMQNQQNEQHEQYEEEYEEYEVIQLPLWKRVLNELRIPFFIMISILIFLNCSFDKLIINKIPFLGNTYNECNTYGFLLKVFLASILSYILIKFVKL